MTFLSSSNPPSGGVQGRLEAPEDLLRALVQRLVQETIQTKSISSSAPGLTSAAMNNVDGATDTNPEPSRRG